MSIMQIKHRTTGAVLYEAEVESLRELVERAAASGADLADANLDGADLGGANLSGADLGGACLDGANLARTNLSGADLSRVDLSGANLDGANLARTNLSGADLGGANLGGANLGGAAGITFAASGWLGSHGWSLIQQEPDDPILLRYGCEEHQLEAWTGELIAQLCAKHRSHDTKLPGQLRALVKFCKKVRK